MNTRTIIIGLMLLVLFDLFIFKCSKKAEETGSESFIENIIASPPILDEVRIDLLQDIWPDAQCYRSSMMGMEPKFDYPINVTGLNGACILPAAFINVRECNTIYQEARGELLFGIAL